MGRKIAIVEDEEAIRENYAVAFRRQGYDVLTYADRPRALEAFEERLPDLAIVDVGLGDEVEGGFDLCRQLRTDPRLYPLSPARRGCRQSVLRRTPGHACERNSESEMPPRAIRRVAHVPTRRRAPRVPSFVRRRGDPRMVPGHLP